MSVAQFGARRGLGLVLALLILAGGCSKKDATSVVPTPTGDPGGTRIGIASESGDAALAALIPDDYVAFGLVNAHALWESAEGQRLRKLAENIDDGKPLKQMEEEMGVAPGNIAHVAFIATSFDEEPIVVVSTIKPYDASKVRQSIELKKYGRMDPPKIREEEYKGKKLFIQPLLTFNKVGDRIGGPDFDVKDKSVPKDKFTPRDKDKFTPKDRIPARDKDKFTPKDRVPPKAEKFNEVQNFNEKGMAPDNDKGSGRALVILGDRAFAVGMDDRIKKWIDRTEGSASVSLSAGVARLGERHHLVVGFNPAGLPAKLTRGIPGPLQPLVKAKAVRGVGDFGAESRFQIKVDFNDENSAQRGEKAIADGINILSLAIPSDIQDIERGAARRPENPFMAPMLAAAKDFQNSLPSIKPVRDGSTVSLGLAVKTAIPDVSPDDINKLKLGALRAKHQNNLKQLGLSFHNWASTYRDNWPTAAICDKDGKPLLSWRVSILPFIEEDALYREFKLDEAWDSPHNIKLLERMPKTYRLPGSDAKSTTTHYQLLVGPKTLYPQYGTAADVAASAGHGIPLGQRGMLAGFSVANIPDGTSNTILIIEANNAVPWSKPEDVMYDAQKPLPKFGKLLPDGFLVGMADGSVRFVSMKVSEKTLRSAIEPADGMPLGSDW